MLAGILNSALLIVIIMDVVGAAVYFGITCLKRFQIGQEESRNATSSFAPFGGRLASLTGGLVPVPAGSAAVALYGRPEPRTETVTRPDEQAAPETFGGRLRTRIESFGGTFSRRRAEAQPMERHTAAQTPEGADAQVPNQVANLNRILDSFKEDL